LDLMMDEASGRWGRLHEEELHDLHSSLNSIRLIKTRRMKRAIMWNAWERGDVHTEF